MIDNELVAQIAKAIQVKTGGNVEGKLPEWWAEFIGMVLAELQSAGRLIPAGGMALTAEESADFLNVIWEGRGDYSSRDRLREKFPTSEHDEARLRRNPETLARTKSALASTEGDTEVTGQDFLDAMPAEPDCWDVCEGHPTPDEPDKGICAERTVTGIRCDRKNGHPGEHRLAKWGPAEPAEEETKAEALQEKVADLESQLEAEIANRDAWEQRLTNLIYSLATVEEVGEWTSSDDLDEKFIDHIGGKMQQLERAALTDQQLADIRTMLGTTFSIEAEYHEAFKRLEADFLTPIPPASSPVVPAPTETGPWQTWQEVPEGVKYKSRADRHPHAPVWINQGGNRLTQLHSGEWAQSALTGDGYSCFAPFVAAEEG